jgi:hypothetical protein
MMMSKPDSTSGQPKKPSPTRELTLSMPMGLKMSPTALPSGSMISME